MLNLIIDAGNTHIKLAVFEDDKIVFKDNTSQNNLKESLQTIRVKYFNIKYVMLSSTGKLNDTDLSYLNTNYKVLELSSDLKFPFKNYYETPKTLGQDRLALLSAAYLMYPNANTLIIDAGTCITFDFITSSNHYLGGAISPGIKIRYKALHDYTVSLPYLEKEQVDNFIGNSTTTCIHSGVVNGVLQEIEGVVSQYHTNYEDLTVILTGGDANFLSKQLKSSIFAHSNFLLKGLNYLLNYNLK